MLGFRPIIQEAVILREKDRRGFQYVGPIEPGAVFAWEPDLPGARELTIVTMVDSDFVWSRPMSGGETCMNKIDRFREAVFATIFKKFPVRYAPTLGLTYPMHRDERNEPESC